MKKLLFVYPICANRYLGSFTNEQKKLLERTIDERYRKKGYQIYFLSFNNIPKENLSFVQKSDIVIFGTMDFDWNTIRLKERCGRGPSPSDTYFLEYWKNESKRMLNYIDYPSFEKIENDLHLDEKKVDCLKAKEKIVIAGFDPYGTPLEFTKYLQNRGYFAEIDLELGKDFSRYSQNYGFMLDTYNPKNIIINDEINTLYYQGITLHKKWSSPILEEDVYCTSSYQPTISKVDAYFYKLCVDFNFSPLKKDEYLSHLQYLFHHLSLEEKKLFQENVTSFYSKYVEFLFQSCSKTDSNRFPFLLHVFREFIERENLVEISCPSNSHNLYRTNGMRSRERFLKNLSSFRKYLLESKNDISFQTESLSEQDIKEYIIKR